LSNEVQYIIDPERISALGGADLANPYARFTPANGVSAEDFSFQNSFDSLKGQTESLSVAGMTGSIDTLDKAIPGRDRDDKKDKDGIGWDDVTAVYERNRAEMMRIGDMDMTRGQVEDTIEFLSDPKNRERAAEEYARRNGTSVEDGRAEMDWFHTYLSTKLAIADGTATPEQIAWMEQQDANPETAGRVARAYETTHALGADTPADQAATLSVGDAQTVVANASTGDAANDDAVAANIDDESTWLAAREAQGLETDEIEYAQEMRSGESDSLAFLGGDTRSGPIVTPDFNYTAAGAPQLAQAQTPTEPRQSATTEIGLG